LLKLKEYLAKKSPDTLIADGEYNPDVRQLIELARENLVDVLLMDIEGYGFTNWRRFMKDHEKMNFKVSPHCWGFKLRTHYAAQFAMANKKTITIEGVPDMTEGVEFDDYRLIDGRLHVPEKPGFGMEFLWGRNF
jgi:D-galactarolactone cycloisomerase